MGGKPIDKVGGGSIGTPELIGTITVNGTTYNKYRKIINIGALPNGTSQSPVEIQVDAGLPAGSYTKILAEYGFATASWGGGFPLPYSSPTLHENIKVGLNMGGKVTIVSAFDARSYDGIIIIEYY